jgi:predicted RNA-binding protein associated with RNAse of E/G family
MRTIAVQLLKPGKGTTVTYRGDLLHAETGHLLIHARWERPRLDLGYLVFEPGDHFYEHYYTQRWFNIFEVRGESGVLKGWYCNVTRPAQLVGDVVISEDLELDLFVPPDRHNILRLDLDEFEARGLARSDPPAYTAALAALDELERMARVGNPPFDSALYFPRVKPEHSPF